MIERSFEKLMKRHVWLGMVVFALCIFAAGAAQAQAMMPGFSGFGVSVGGGSMDFRGESPTEVASAIRPDERVGTVAGGALLLLGTRRWALIVPEFHVQMAASDPQPLSGVLTVGSTALPFASTSRAATAWALVGGGQIGIVPSGVVWVRGGIGTGGISTRVETDNGIAIDLKQNLGLALSAAVGGSLWTRRIEGRSLHRVIGLEAQLHYLRIREDKMHLTLPSLRVGFRFHFEPVKQP